MLSLQKYVYKKLLVFFFFSPFLTVNWYIFITTESLAKICNMVIPKRTEFAIQTCKTCRYAYSIIFAFSISLDNSSQYYTEISCIFCLKSRWISQRFGVYLTLSSHFALVFYELKCIVRVISAANFENTWPSHSANFEKLKEIETRLNILLNKTCKIITIELSLSSIFRIGNLTNSDQRSSLHSHFILPGNITTIKRLEKKTAVFIKCCCSNHTINY